MKKLTIISTIISIIVLITTIININISNSPYWTICWFYIIPFVISTLLLYNIQTFDPRQVLSLDDYVFCCWFPGFNWASCIILLGYLLYYILNQFISNYKFK